MPVIPTGVPAWLRQNSFASYGGDLEKRNFASRGVINPKTDVGAEAFSRITADLAACALTAPAAVMTILCDDTPPAAPTVEYASLMTGVRTTSYLGSSPPTGFPAVTRNGNGDLSITFSASYSDPYGISGAFTAKHVRAQLNGSVAGMATATIISATIVRVRAFVAAGTAMSNARVTVVVGSGA